MPPQKPLRQLEPQHASPATHADPNGVHSAPPQNPFVAQSKLQQSMVSVHALPSGWQRASSAHEPSTHASPEQHESSDAHGAFADAHVPFPSVKPTPRAPHDATPTAVAPNASKAAPIVTAVRRRIGGRSYHRARASYAATER